MKSAAELRRESQLTPGIGYLYDGVIQGASVYHAERRLRIAVDLPNSKDKERGEKMRHTAAGGGGGGQSATRGCISSPSRVKNQPAEGSPLWPGGGDTARLTTEVCTQGADGPRERRQRQDSRDNVPASEGPECNRDSLHDDLGFAPSLRGPLCLGCARAGRQRQMAGRRLSRVCAQRRRENGSPVSFP